MRHLLDKLLIADPVRRATVGDIEADPWFFGPDGLGIAGADVPLVRVGAPPSSHLAAAHASVGAPAAAAAAAIQTTTMQHPPTAGHTATAAGGGGGGGTMTHVPSAKEIDDAVEDIDDSNCEVRGRGGVCLCETMVMCARSGGCRVCALFEYIFHVVNILFFRLPGVLLLCAPHRPRDRAQPPPAR